jgi:pyruvate ferredoxin oxidoreductase alpha subunit
MEALDVIPEVAQRFAIDFGRPSGGLVRRYRTEGAETIIVALGSVLGTIESVVDELRESGVGRRPRHQIVPPLPARRGPRGAHRRLPVVVLEKALAVGRGGSCPPTSTRRCTARSPLQRVVAARRRSITRESLRDLFERAGRDELGPLGFLDLKTDLVERELERAHRGTPSGPHEQNILTDIGVVAAGPH